MPQQSEKAPMRLVIPHLNLVIIASGDEERLGLVEVDAADGAVVLLEAVDERPHAVVPELDDTAVEAGEDPWTLGVEAQPLNAVALGLEFRQHRRDLGR